MKEEIKLSDVVRELPFNVSKNLYMGSLRNFAHRKHEFDFNVFLPTKGKNLQRGLVWTLFQKQELIMSVLKGVSIPNPSVIQYKGKDKEPVIKVVDGKQRLDALFGFVNNEFPINLLGKDYYYDELPEYKNPSESIRYKIDSFPVHFDLAYEYYDDLISDDDKIAWFERINFFGTAQDKAHLQNLKEINITEIKFTATKEELEFIHKILDRSFKLYSSRFYRLSLKMDLEATHCNGNPLDFEKLLNFDQSDFFHDVIGITNNLDRSTGKLTNNFIPRCSKQLK
jgi:hypothetical protein